MPATQTMKKAATLYKCGLVPSCPLSVVHLGGFEFPKKTEKVERGGDGDMKRSELPGVVHALTEADVARIFASLKKKRIRSTSGKRARAWLTQTDAGGYQAVDGDAPLDAYVYLTPTDYDPQRGEVFKTIGGLPVPRPKGADQADRLESMEKAIADLLEQATSSGDRAQALELRAVEAEKKAAEAEAKAEALAADLEAATRPAPAPEAKGKKPTGKTKS